MSIGDFSADELGVDGLGLPMPPQPHPYLARMARWADGPEHARARAAVVAALPPFAGLDVASQTCTAARLTDRLDVVPLAKSVPVAVLGEALGVGDLTEQIAALCDQGVVAPELPDIAVTSLLFQCRDATAALVLTALADAVPVEAVVPVLRTRRAGGTWVSLADAPYGAGAHACPGREHALALSRGMVRALVNYEVVALGADEDRPNMRVPSSLVMQRR